MSAPNAGPPVTCSVMPSMACSARSTRTSPMMPAVSVLLSPTSIGITRPGAALPSSLTIGPSDASAARASSTGSRSSSAVRSLSSKASPSSREATTMIDCLSASGNCSSSASTRDDSESSGAGFVPSRAWELPNTPKRATMAMMAAASDHQAPLREVSLLFEACVNGAVLHAFNFTSDGDSDHLPHDGSVCQSFGCQSNG